MEPSPRLLSCSTSASTSTVAGGVRGRAAAAAAARAAAVMACRGTRSRVDGEEMCTVCLEPLPLPGPGADVVLVLHACGHCFHRDCAQRMLLASLRKHQKPRCPNCRATLATAPFGTLLGQRKQPREKRMRNMRELLSVSEVRRARGGARGEGGGGGRTPPIFPSTSTLLKPSFLTVISRSLFIRNR